MKLKRWTLTIGQNEKYFFLDLLFFLFCLVNRYTLIIWLIFMPVAKIYSNKTIGAIEALILIAIRTTLNGGIAYSMSAVSMLKLSIIMALSLYIILSTRKNKLLSQVNLILIFLTVFSLFCIYTSVSNSSYPFVACLKVVSYYLPFVAIIIGINSVPMENRNRGIEYINRFLGLLIFTGMLFISSSVAYKVNGYSFQGLFLHPNLFGIITVVFIAGYLAKNNKRFGLINLIIVGLSVYMIFLSRSRTAMFAAVFVIVVYVILSGLTNAKKIGIIITCAIVLIIFMMFNKDGIIQNIQNFIYKGNGSSIFFSRENQIESLINNFRNHPLFGTGFNVPYVSGYRSYSFTLDATTETGNLFLAVLSYSGIIGFVLFLIAYGYIFKSGKNVLLFLTPVFVSMGEMAFFSTNNCAILYYVFIATYIYNGAERTKPNECINNNHENISDEKYLNDKNVSADTFRLHS